MLIYFIFLILSMIIYIFSVIKYQDNIIILVILNFILIFLIIICYSISILRLKIFLNQIFYKQAQKSFKSLQKMVNIAMIKFYVNNILRIITPSIIGIGYQGNRDSKSIVYLFHRIRKYMSSIKTIFIYFVITLIISSIEFLLFNFSRIDSSESFNSIIHKSVYIIQNNNNFLELIIYVATIIFVFIFFRGSSWKFKRNISRYNNDCIIEILRVNEKLLYESEELLDVSVDMIKYIFNNINYSTYEISKFIKNNDFNFDKYNNKKKELKEVVDEFGSHYVALHAFRIRYRDFDRMITFINNNYEIKYIEKKINNKKGGIGKEISKDILELMNDMYCIHKYINKMNNIYDISRNNFEQSFKMLFNKE